MKMQTINLYNNEKPLFHSTKSSHDGLTLFLDFNKKDILQGLYYTSDEDNPWFKCLSSLAKEVEGKEFSDLEGLSFNSYKTLPDSFLDLPRFLLKEALVSYRGNVPALFDLKSQKESDLICRCFGIYKEELLLILDEFPEYTAKDLTNATKAGAGCTTCLSDFPEILSEARVRQAKKLLN